MKKFTHIEPYRITTGPLATNPDDSPGSGLFALPLKPGYLAICLASDGNHMIEETGWEHVSCHVMFEYGKSIKGKARKRKNRLPSQKEIYLVKNVFWDPYEPVAQFYDKESMDKDGFKSNIHLWLPVEESQAAPPSNLFTASLNYIRSASSSSSESPA